MDTTTDRWDARPSMAGPPVGRRATWAATADLVRGYYAAAATARQLADRPRAAQYLADGARLRRRYTERVTPAPAPPAEPPPAGHAWEWSPTMRTWWARPTH